MARKINNTNVIPTVISEFVNGYSAPSSKRIRSVAIRAFLAIKYEIEATGNDLRGYEDYGATYLTKIRGEYLANNRRSITLINDLHTFRNLLMEKKKSGMYVYSNLTSILLWMEHHGIDISRGDRKAVFRRAPKRRGETEEEPLTREKIRTILAYAPPPLKALIMTLLSTGMRLGEALNITTENLNDLVNPTEIIIPAEFTKTRVRRTVFLNKEGQEAMRQWLHYRPEYLKIKSAKHNHGLPVDENDRRIFPFNDSTATNAFILATKKAGLKKKDGKTHHYAIHLHSFRKYFRTMLPKGGNGNSVDCTELLMGHEGYLTGAYLRYTIDDLRTFYRSAEYVLYVTTSVSIKDPEADKKIEEQAKEIYTLKKQVDNLSSVLGILMKDTDVIKAGLKIPELTPRFG